MLGELVAQCARMGGKSTMQLVIANKNYSSWSLRAWLYLTEAGVPFEEHRIPLFVGDWRDQVVKFNPTGRLPALVDGAVRVWDSWAIVEYVRATHEVAFSWPDEPVRRGHALSVASEMHAGFLAVRRELPMNIRAQPSPRWEALSDDARQQVRRIVDVWSDCLARHGGPYLFGEQLCLADIAYAPVASRFSTYGIELPAPCRDYIHAIFELEGMRRWCAEAREEREHIDFVDELAADTPLNPG
jgi:glutathione S-transferase